MAELGMHPLRMALYEDREFLMIRKLYQKFGMITPEQPSHITKETALRRARFMAEELQEFIKAAEEQNIVKMFDALLDLDVVAKGTAVMMGLPWRDGFEAVNEANSAKERGVTHRGNKVDLVKPPGWVGPETALQAALEDAGYAPEKWGLPGSVAEHLCLDDERDSKDA